MSMSMSVFPSAEITVETSHHREADDDAGAAQRRGDPSGGDGAASATAEGRGGDDAAAAAAVVAEGGGGVVEEVAGGRRLEETVYRYRDFAAVVPVPVSATLQHPSSRQAMKLPAKLALILADRGETPSAARIPLTLLN